MWYIPQNLPLLAVLVCVPTCLMFHIQQLPEFHDVIRDNVLGAVDAIQEQYNIAGTLGPALLNITPALQQRAAADLSYLTNFLQCQITQNRTRLSESVKAIMPLVVNPLVLASGVCNTTSAPWPPAPPNCTDPTYLDLLWEAKFTSKLDDHISFQGTVGLDIAGKGIRGFGIEVQPDSLASNYSIGMQWSFQRNVTGFTFVVAISSDELQKIGLADIHLIYSHPHWLCTSQCGPTAFFQNTSNLSSTPVLNASNVARFMESTVLHGFGVTFQKFSGPEIDMISMISQFPGSLYDLTTAPLRPHLAAIQSKLQSPSQGANLKFSFNIRDVTTIWTNTTLYQKINSSYCPRCGNALQKPFGVDPSNGIASIEGIMLTNTLVAPFTVGQPSDTDLTLGLKGQVRITPSSGCDATHVLMATPNASLGALVNLVEDSYSSGVTNRLLDVMGPGAETAVQNVMLNISVCRSGVEVTLLAPELPWLPAGASQTNNLLLWLTSAAFSPKVGISMTAQFHVQLELEFSMQSLADPDGPTIFRFASQDGSGLNVKAYMQTYEQINQVSHSLLASMPLVVCMAGCSNPTGQKQQVYFTGSAHPMQSGLVGTLYSDANWTQAFGYPFMRINGMDMQVDWPIGEYRPTDATWQGVLCLGTTKDCATGRQPSITGRISAGINVSGAEGNYFIGELPQFELGTLIDTIVKYASMHIAPVITDALVLPQHLLPSGECQFVETAGPEGNLGCFVSLTFPDYTDRNYLPDHIQFNGQLRLSDWLLNVTIDVVNYTVVVTGAVPLWCLSIRGVCEMDLGGVLNDCHAQGPSALKISAGQQGASLQITGAMDIPTLKGCGMVTVYLVDDLTFRATAPFSLLSGSWLTTANITWPVDKSSFLVETGPIIFPENVPVLTDVRYYVDGKSPVPPGGSFTLQTTWSLLSFVEPNTDIEFVDDRILFSLQTSGLEGVDPLLKDTLFDVYGEGQLKPSGTIENADLHVKMNWQVEKQMNAYINKTTINLTTAMVRSINDATAQVDQLFQEVQEIFNTTLLPMRNALAWGLENITVFLSSEFGVALESYDGTYVQEPSPDRLNYPIDQYQTGYVNAYGCPQYQIFTLLNCMGDRCEVNDQSPYFRSDCMNPKIVALGIVQSRRDAMALRQADIETTKKTNPSFYAIAQTLGLLPPDGPIFPLSTLIPYIPMTVTLYLNPSQPKPTRKLLQSDPCVFACADYNNIHTKTPTFTGTATATKTYRKLGAELPVLGSKFAPQEETAPAFSSSQTFSITTAIDISDISSFGTSIQQSSNTAASGITDIISVGNDRWVALDVLGQNYSAPSLDPALDLTLPCTGGDIYGAPPTAHFDPGCAQGAILRAIGTVAMPSPCGQTILKLTWQAFDNATCTGKSNVVEQTVIQSGPSQLHFATFPADATILNTMSIGLGNFGTPTSPPPECNLTSIIFFNDTLARRLPQPGTWAIGRVWSIVPTAVKCVNPSDEEAYKISLSYAQVQRIVIQDATPPVFTYTPSSPLILAEGTQPDPSLTGVPQAVDPINSDLLGRGVNASTVSITHTDVLTTLPDLFMDRHIGFDQYNRTWRATDEAGNYAIFEQTIYVKLHTNSSDCPDCAPVDPQCKAEEDKHPGYLHTDLPHCYDPADLLAKLAPYGCHESETPNCNLIICDNYVPPEAWAQLQMIPCNQP